MCMPHAVFFRALQALSNWSHRKTYLVALERETVLYFGVP